MGFIQFKLFDVNILVNFCALLLIRNFVAIITFVAFWSDFNEVPVCVNVAKVFGSLLIKFLSSALLYT